MSALTKLIVSNLAPLRNKYGKGLEQIEAALARVLSADLSRGIETQVVWLDEPGVQDAAGSPIMGTATSDQQARAAVEAVIAQQGEPDYLVLLGGPDVLPHIHLTNPVNDKDTTVPSDLPYACAGLFSRDTGAYVGPTRKVGRVPDVAGGRDVNVLVKLLDQISAFQAVDRTHYDTYTAACAAQFEGTTRLTVKNLFGNDSQLALSPPYELKKGAMMANPQAAHFYDVHGGAKNSTWYGRDKAGTKFVELLRSTGVPSLPQNTLVSTEACYGTQLYAPTDSTLPLCNQLLLQGAIGLFGSTDTLYGDLTNGQQVQGDLLTQFFLAQVLSNSSTLGQGTLDARHQFVSRCGDVMSPYDTKTLAQCLLLGDPSLRPVTQATAASAHGIELPSTAADQATAASRRRHARSRAQGEHLRASTSVARHKARGVPSGILELTMRAWIKKLGLVKVEFNTYEAPALRSGAPPVRFYEVRGSLRLSRRLKAALPPNAAFLHPQLVILAREEHGQIVDVRVLQRR
jgi:hypothetical protein